MRTSPDVASGSVMWYKYKPTAGLSHSGRSWFCVQEHISLIESQVKVLPSDRQSQQEVTFRSCFRGGFFKVFAHNNIMCILFYDECACDYAY